MQFHSPLDIGAEPRTWLALCGSTPEAAPQSASRLFRPIPPDARPFPRPPLSLPRPRPRPATPPPALRLPPPWSPPRPRTMFMLLSSSSPSSLSNDDGSAGPRRPAPSCPRPVKERPQWPLRPRLPPRPRLPYILAKLESSLIETQQHQEWLLFGKTNRIACLR